MTERAQRGSRVIYVATSARELPEPVQEWLSQPNVRAAACPNIYDALANLARGRTPLALIVHIESVDWSELDFFTHARRVSSDTRLYVAGAPHQNAKIEAAVGLGAIRFDADALDELLTAKPATPRSVGPAGLLAGSLRTDVETPTAAPRLVRETPEPPAPTSTDDDEADRPAVRLVSAAETQESDPAVPFPWSPSPDRPQRTPPKPACAGSRDTAKANREAQKESARRPPVKLTPEELSALLEPPAGGGKIQEGSS